LNTPIDVAVVVGLIIVGLIVVVVVVVSIILMRVSNSALLMRALAGTACCILN
jgi:hypothetical protein